MARKKSQTKRDEAFKFLVDQLENNGAAIKEGPKRKSYSIHDLKTIKPLNYAQRTMMESFMNGSHVVADGSAGTGKSFIALYLALTEVLNKESKISNIIIVRSATPSKDVGFLPGSLEEKLAVYELPYKDIVADLLKSKEAYEISKANGSIQFMSTSFVRGLTWENAVVIFDEAQNCTDAEIHSVMTRIGDNSKVIICGDYGQNDLINKKYEMSGYIQMLKTVERMDCFDVVNFTVHDIVRSKFVKEWIIARENA